MREGWAKRKLVELADVSTGKWDANHATEKGKYRFYTCAYDFGYCNTNRFSGASLILPGNGVNVGEVFYYDGEFDAYQRTYVVNNTKVVPRYLYYHMQLHWKEVGTKKQYGSATNFIKIGNFQDYDVEYPASEAEQKRIVEILDEAFAAIDKAKANVEKNLQNAKEVFESYLRNVFDETDNGWEENNLGEICVFKGGGTPSTKVKKYWDGNIPWVSPKDMKSKIVIDSQDHVSVDAIENSSTSLIPPQAILVVVRSGILARIVPIGITGRELTINQDLKALCPSKKINSNFLYYFLHSKMKILLSKVTRGATVHRLTTDSLRGLTIRFPSLKEQTTIVQNIDSSFSEIQRLQSIYEQKLIDLEELKKSILQKAFTGELTTKAVLDI